MPRTYVKGGKERPDKPGDACETQGCANTTSSAWTKGVCAACRVGFSRKRKAAPLADVSNNLPRTGIFCMDYAAGLPHQDAASPAQQPSPEVAGAATPAGEQSPWSPRYIALLNANSCLEAELARVKAELATERALAAKLLRTAVEFAFDGDDECRVRDIEKATGCKVNDARWGLRQRMKEYALIQLRGYASADDAACDPRAKFQWCLDE